MSPHYRPLKKAKGKSKEELQAKAVALAALADGTSTADLAAAKDKRNESAYMGEVKKSFIELPLLC